MGSVGEIGMRILVLGAGALGGYFGGRLLQAGADLAFLVRPRRAAQLAEAGLVIESPLGDAHLRPVRALDQAAAADEAWDVILLTCKAYDLDDAIAAIRPAVTPGRTAILPVLNGLSHLDTLRDAFGADAVLGGLAKIQATLAPDGTVRQLNDWRYLGFGELNGSTSPRIQALAAIAGRAPGVVAEAVPDVMDRMWEKLVHLGTSAIGTVLLRASTGEIALSPGGVAFMHRVLDRNAAIAAAAGHPVRPAFLAEIRQVFGDPAGAYTTSMLRDLEAGGRIESDHILGFLLEAARRHGVPDEVHEAAFLHAKAFERRRETGRLPAPGRHP
jgi:2-dehydropantoate 2-reductase